MAAESNAPIIIKRKKVVAEGGHHGGAWKVAYADFVTAMMAFFLLMWLLNATTEKQRKGLADHFSPTIPINRSSGGGSGALGGDSIFTEETLSQSGIGASGDNPRAEASDDPPSDEEPAPIDTQIRAAEAMLRGLEEDNVLSEDELRNLTIFVTEAGVGVELFSTEDAPLFQPGSDAPTALFDTLLTSVGRIFDLVDNPILVDGHSREHAVVLREDIAWPRSLRRAELAKERLEEIVDGDRFERVTGHGDRRHSVPNPMAVRNDRIALTLLRTTPPTP